ncbi:hypothetical protein BHE74_00044721 [Ensete ventricosum]|nr:hypothetical protein BHE74_00044721 [Ensete ventricosum]
MCSNHSSPFCCFPLVHKHRALYPLNLARIQQWQLLTEGELSILGRRGRPVLRELRWFTTYREMDTWSTLTSWRSLSPHHHQDSTSEVFAFLRIRSYRNGYVWQDLSEDDFIHPVHGNEYVLKGTELLHLNSSSSSCGSQQLSLSSSTSSKCVQEDSAASFSRRKQATMSSFYKSNTSAETTASSTDASTQTEEHNKQQRRAPVAEVKRRENSKSVTVAVKHVATELSRDEVSPPPSSSSPETLIKADGRCIMAVRPEEKGWSVGGCFSGRVKASAVLMHLISCGSMSAKANGLSLMPQYSGRRLDRAESMGHMPSFRSMSLEEKEEDFTNKMGGW